MLIGYARVSTTDQNLDLQLDALNKAGCEKIFTDTLSGGRVTQDRPGLDAALSHLRQGDVLVVWRLDRLGRSLKHLIEVVDDLKARQIGFRSLQENMDTTTSMGILIFHLFGALAEFERSIIKERTLAGIAAAKARGRTGGRPLKHSEKKIKNAVKLAESSEDTINEICKELGISRATYYRRTKQD